MEKLEVYECSESEWSNALNGQKQSIFADPRWVGVMGEKSGKTLFLVVKQNNRPIAKACGIAINVRHFGGTRLFFYTYPVVLPGEYILQKSMEAIRDYAGKHRYSQVIFDYYDRQVYDEGGFPQGFLPYKRAEFVIDYQNGYVGHKLTSSIKGKIKQALKTGPTVEEETWESIPYFIKLLEDTRQSRIGRNRNDYDPFSMPLFSERDIKPLIENGMIRVFSCRDSEQNIHFMAMCVMSKKGVYGLMNGCDEFGYKNGYPGYTIDYLIKKFQHEQYDYFNMGPVPKEQGNAMAVFKSGLGAVPIITYGLKTDFLVFPYQMANPVVRFARKIPYGPVLKKLSDLMRV
ncbi:MAG: hypothetical protein QM786_14725 [Breznakibacter sp.]